ncbi:MAG: PDZ domain-containing protein [Deltaproteobacteria bacterium]|nr:PDZ domain-containing protein [Deltaproteobacteria bacterium]
MKKLKWIVLALMITQSVLRAATATPTPEEYWDQTSFKFADLKAKISSTACYKSQATFIGCVAAIDTLFAMAGISNVLISEDRMKDYGELKKDFGDLKWVTPIEREDLPPVELVQAYRKMKRDDYQSLNSLYKNSKVNFDEIIKFAEDEVSPRVKSMAMASGYAFNAYLNATKDPHTRIMPSRQWNDLFNENSNGDLIGVGAVIRKINKQFIIFTTLENGPAFRAGLKSGDIILQVGNEDVNKLEINELIKKLRGPEGSEVKILILRGNSVLERTILREKIVQPNVESKIIQRAIGEKTIGYIKVRDFIPKVCDKVKEKIDQFMEAKSDQKIPEALILDLRGNLGGLLNEAVCMTGIFVGEGVIAKTRSLQADIQTAKISQEKQKTLLPVVTLINGRSASASEIVAGALQDWQRSYLVGDRSYGKGTGQGISGDPNFSGIYRFETIQRFYLPSGRTNQIVGILPDFQAYSAPQATEMDKLASREEDEYLNPLPFEGAPYVSLRPEAIRNIKDCVDQTGTAAKTFNENQNASLAPDYQLLYAEDVLACIP